MLFGSNTILVFKYPLLKRKLQEARDLLSQRTPGMDDDDLEREARAYVISHGLIANNDDNEENKADESEEDALKRMITVEDYSEEEIEQDIAMVDWDFAYNEILKIEQRKKDKSEMEAARKWQEEMRRVEQEHRISLIILL